MEILMEAGKKFVKSQGVDIDKGQDSPSGMWWVDETAGSGGSPKATDRVKVHYSGWLTNGTKFDSSYDRGQPAEFRLNGVIKGWTEGVGSMKVGGKRWLVLPPDLAYGDRGAPPVIEGGAVLVFVVELLGIR
jgi:FKBP-type peptidyl-prolyl cis-trans isomerase FkpA